MAGKIHELSVISICIYDANVNRKIDTLRPTFVSPQLCSAEGLPSSGQARQVSSIAVAGGATLLASPLLPAFFSLLWVNWRTMIPLSLSRVSSRLRFQSPNFVVVLFVLCFRSPLHAPMDSDSKTEAIKRAKVLMVGAGGIGCELLKTLALSGFQDIHIEESRSWAGIKHVRRLDVEPKDWSTCRQKALCHEFGHWARSIGYYTKEI
ncbi:hypothetical protein MUK42_20841 [Musa troglodytarum]|uniref:THIF-type NAD/FAD binding fold domain-containing protein n=1 Tax=Musa troglodytarum TaxID=320322 RepID=A0A9E7G440_9LILI|nr:hypothetical protein MUK42_20841 [Musa troglodytarum]